MDESKISSEVSAKYSFDKNTFIGVAKPDPKDKIDIEIGDSKQPDFKPQVKIMRWDNETNLSLRLVHNETNPTVTTEKGAIAWIGDKVDARFYDVKDDPEVPYTSIRHIDFGNLSPEKMSASYDLFRKQKQDKLVALSYRPNQEMYWLLGNYRPEYDLKMELVEKPITRYRSRGSSYPMMFVDNNTLIIDFVFPNRETNLPILESVKEVLLEYRFKGVVTEPEGGRIYFEKDGVTKKFLSYGGDKNHFILYLTLSTPTYDFKSTYKDRPIGAYEYGGLDEIIKIDEKIQDLFIQKIAEKTGLIYESSELTIDESGVLDSFSVEYSQPDWINLGKTELYIPESLDLGATGGMEFDIYLKEKPITNEVLFTLNTKALNFFYQPELTDEEKYRGGYRPQHAVGSYAVYTAEERKNFEGGKVYGTGKVGHIYRPRITDSAGREAWGVLSIGDGFLKVTLPQDFVDNAVYPIKQSAGLTFGYTTGGATSSSSATNLNGYKFSGAAGTGTSMSVYSKAYLGGSGQTRKLGVYDSSLNLFTNGTANEVTVTTSGTPDWATGNFASSPTFTAVDYYLATANVVASKGNGPWIYWDTGDTGFGFTLFTTYASQLMATVTGHTTNALKYSIYVTYTPNVFGNLSETGVEFPGGGGEIFTSMFTAPENGTLTNMSVRLGADVAGPVDVALALYAWVSDTNAGALLAYSDYASESIALAPAWFTRSVSYTLVAGTKYFLAVATKGSSDECYVYASASSRGLLVDYTTSLSDPFVEDDSDPDNLLAIYATYTAGAPATNSNFLMFMR